MPDCRTFIPSENVVDFIVRFNVNYTDVPNVYENYCLQTVNNKFLILYVDEDEVADIRLRNM